MMYTWENEVNRHMKQQSKYQRPKQFSTWPTVSPEIVYVKISSRSSTLNNSENIKHSSKRYI